MESPKVESRQVSSPDPQVLQIRQHTDSVIEVRHLEPSTVVENADVLGLLREPCYRGKIALRGENAPELRLSDSAELLQY